MLRPRPSGLTVGGCSLRKAEKFLSASFPVQGYASSTLAERQSLKKKSLKQPRHAADNQRGEREGGRRDRQPPRGELVLGKGVCREPRGHMNIGRPHGVSVRRRFSSFHQPRGHGLRLLTRYPRAGARLSTGASPNHDSPDYIQTPWSWRAPVSWPHMRP
jgi:hypothetical protein